MEHKRILFLDYDGVVNSVVWWKSLEGKIRYDFAYPGDKMVNNWQAICFLNKLYEEYPYDIVLTTSWRECGPFKIIADCLYNGGLDKKIKVIDMVERPRAGYFDSPAWRRDSLIELWLNKNNFTDTYIILDDDDYYSKNERLVDHTILTQGQYGFDRKCYEKAISKIKAQEEIFANI